MDKQQKIVELRVGDLKLDFGNPRKIKPQKKKSLADSLKRYGDFDIITINEELQVLGGNQRVTILQDEDPEQIVTCKMLIGYTLQEQKYINIKLNTHAGEWNLDELADWTADLMNFDVDVDTKDKPIDERKIQDMELIHYEKYDYVLIACRNELDYNDLIRKLGIEDKTVKIAKSRKIKARAIWYDKMQAKIVPFNDGDDE